MASRNVPAGILNKYCYTTRMPIYTKTGDTGKTSLFGGSRVSKSHPQVNAYGTIDELSSVLGLVITKIDDTTEQDFLTIIQKDLYQMMASLAGATNITPPTEDAILAFETKIDTLEKTLPKLTRFILPGGTELGSWFHILRTTTRRAEREAVEFFTSESTHAISEDCQAIMLKYLNRLSDLFFMYARKYAEGKETIT